MCLELKYYFFVKEVMLMIYLRSSLYFQQYLLLLCYLIQMFSRSYTPPTCTLKVTARGLPFLKWFGIRRQQRFSLSFDDPRV